MCFFCFLACLNLVGGLRYEVAPGGLVDGGCEGSEGVGFYMLVRSCSGTRA